MTFGLGVAALVVAASGSALAVPVVHSAAQIDGSRIAKHSMPGNRLENDAVTGKQVKESSLGVVPKAANASKLGGVPAAGYLRSNRFFSFYDAMSDSDSPKVLGTFGPLTFTGTCTYNGEFGVAIATISVTTSKAMNIASSGANGDDVTPRAAGTTVELAHTEGVDSHNAGVAQLNAYLPDASFIVTPSSTVVAVGATGSNEQGCEFYGQLVNVGV